MTAPERTALAYSTPVRTTTSSIAIITKPAVQAVPEVMWWATLKPATLGCPAVSDPNREDHAGPDADNPQDRSYKPGPGEGTGPLATDAGGQAGQGAKGSSGGGQAELEDGVVAGGGHAVEELGRDPDRDHNRARSGGLG